MNGKLCVFTSGLDSVCEPRLTAAKRSTWVKPHFASPCSHSSYPTEQHRCSALVIPVLCRFHNTYRCHLLKLIELFSWGISNKAPADVTHWTVLVQENKLWPGTNSFFILFLLHNGICLFVQTSTGKNEQLVFLWPSVQARRMLLYQQCHHGARGCSDSPACLLIIVV